MNITVVSLYTTEINEFACIAEQINSLYCDYHKYSFHCFYECDKSRHPSWGKIQAVLKVLSQADYVMWIDADACFNRLDIKIEDIIRHNPSGEMIFSYNPDQWMCAHIMGGQLVPYSEVCAGIFITKNSEWSKNFLNTWYASGEAWDGKFLFHNPYEQRLLNDYMLPLYGEKVTCLSSSIINSCFYPNCYDYESFLIHFMGQPNNVRIFEMKKILEKMILKKSELSL